MTRHCDEKSVAHVQDGRQLDCAGCVPVDNSIQVWTPVVESVWRAPPHYAFSLTPGDSPYLAQSDSSTPHPGISLKWHSLLVQSGLSI